MNSKLQLDHLVTEARNPASSNLDEITALELVRLMNAEDARVIPAIAEQAEAIARAVEVIADRLRAGGRLIYAGAGTSGRLGVLDATECPPTFNSPLGQVIGVIAGGNEALTRAVEGAEDHPEFGERDLAELQVSANDVVIGIATSGRTPYVLGATAYARSRGAFTIGLSCNPESNLSEAVDLPITIIVGPEVLSGSTRLKAGTATKLVLNMLSTGAMVRLGKTYGNLMVDLRATNNKLKARTNRIVRMVIGVSEKQAGELLQRCGGELKTALVVGLTGVSVEEARKGLTEFGGRVREVIQKKKRGPVPPDERDQKISGLLLGIDGGGSKTRALLVCLVDDATEPNLFVQLGTGEATSSNLHSVGQAAALAALDSAIGKAFTAAGLLRQPVLAACFGLAGAARPEDQQSILDWANSASIAEKVEVTSDTSLLLEAGTPEGWGLALVAGTGSMAFGRTPDGQTARAGGWGYLLGDEGSGYAIAMAGLQAVARAADGRGPATVMTREFLKVFRVDKPQGLISEVYGGNWDRTKLAALAPVVFEAVSSDEVASQIVQEAALSLAQAAAAVVKQLKWDKPSIPLALAGGVLLGCDSYCQRLLEAMTRFDLHFNAIRKVTNPAEGAIFRLARQLKCKSANSV